MVRQRHNDSPTRQRQFADRLKRDRGAAGLGPEDAADTINANGYPHDDPKDPIPPLKGNDWRRMEDGSSFPRAGRRFVDAYRRAGLGNAGDLERGLKHDILHDKLGDRADEFL